jgi:curli biogenesis system outer membrane secretion channel CsgG
MKPEGIRMRAGVRKFAFGWLLVMALVPLFGVDEPAGPGSTTTTKKTQEKKEPQREDRCPNGFKRSVAVYEIERKAPGSYGDVGDVLVEMLQTALVESGCFVVVERADLSQIQKEQRLKESRQARAGASAATAGKLIPAQALVMGAITTYAENESGGAIGGAFGGGRFGGIAGKKAKVTLDLRLVDTTTGEVTATGTAVGEASATAVIVGGIPVGNIRVGTGAWHQTPIGKAARKAVDQAVSFILAKMKDVPWQAKVSLYKPDSGLIYINQGKNAGIKEGDTLYLYSVGEEIVDPDTGAVLGQETEKIAILTVTKVEDKFSVARMEVSLKEGESPAPGDIIRER